MVEEGKAKGGAFKVVAREDATGKALVRITLLVGKHYRWSLEDSSRKPLIGPYDFDLLVFDPLAVSGAVDMNAAGRIIEILN